jgi:DnaK suppressor protein
VPNAKITDSHLTDSDLEMFRGLLVKKRSEVASLYQLDVKAGQESTDDNADDFADRANNSYNRETMFALSDVERTLVFEIDEALKRLQNGKFGYCTHSGNEIGIERLKAIPWARYCIEVQELHEKGLLEE